MMEQQASVCCLLVMRVTLCSGLGPAWNVDQDDLMAPCVVLYPQFCSPAQLLSPVTLLGLCSQVPLQANINEQFFKCCCEDG